MPDAAQQRQKPLSDILVLEMAQLIAGPFCGQLLADFGAEVIKIEQPNGGDPMREWGKEKPHGKALWFPVIGRNKKSITLDVRKPEGQEVVLRLVERADVLIENFRPGTMENWNLGYDQLSKINPGLIMVRVSGFGQTGPYSKRAGYGAIGEAMGGLRHVTGAPSLPPSRAGISIGDSLAATFACVGALVALHARSRTGRGQVVDSAIYEAVLAVMENLVSDYDVGGYIRERTGSFLPRIAPSNVYPTKDGGLLLIGANQDTVFRRLCMAMKRSELAEDPRFASHQARGNNQVELDELIADWTRTFDADVLEALLHESGVPAGKIYRAPEMLSDPHFAAREAIIRIMHGEFGNMAMQNVFPKLSETPGGVERPGPSLGQHNREIYRDVLGMDDARLAELRERGVI